MRLATAGVVALVALVAWPSGVAEPWLESRHDAARSGSTTDPGPAFNETAFRVALDGPRGLSAIPLILNGAAYVLTHTMAPYSDVGYNESGRNAVWRISLDTGVAHVLFDFEHAGFWAEAPTMLSDGRFIYLVATGRVEAYDTVTDTGPVTVWARPLTLADTTPHQVGWFCNPSTMNAGVMYIGCMEIAGSQDEGGGGRTVAAFVSVIGALRMHGLDDANEQWARIIPPTRPYDSERPALGPDPDVCRDLDDSTSGASAPACAAYPLLMGHSVVEGRFVAVLATGAVLDILVPGELGPTNEAVIAEPALAAFDSETGDILWARHHPTDETVNEVVRSGDEPEYKAWDRVLKTEVTGADRFIFSREPDLVWLTAVDGDRVADPVPVSDTDVTSTATAPGFALRGDELFVSSEQAIKRFD